MRKKAAKQKPPAKKQVQLVTVKAKPQRKSRADRELEFAMGEFTRPMLPTVRGHKIAEFRGTRRTTRPIAATYDAAQTVDDNRRHWASADSLSANAANSPSVRQVLRNRARYEVGSNSYAKGIILTLAYDLVGTGPRLQMLGDDQELNQRIEAYWRSYVRAIRLAAKLRTLVQAKVVDGEAFALPITNRALPGVQLDLRPLEADLFTSLGTDSLAVNEVDGIVFDADGNPQTYKMLKAHPGDGKGAIFQTTEIKASQVYHWFRCDRPGQVRGVPEITPALPLFAQLRRYTLSVLTAAESAAEHSGLIYTDSPPDDMTVDMAPLETLETERGMWTFLPGGWKMGQFTAEQPTTEYGDFKSEIVGEIGRCVNMPILLALLRAKDYNMASGRLDLQTYFKTLEVERDDLAGVVLDPLFTAWLQEASKVYEFKVDADSGHEWLWTTREHTDPADEATATMNRRRTWRSSLSQEYARTGDDWYPTMKQIVREAKAVAEELGVSVPEALGVLGLTGGISTPGRPAGVPNGGGGTRDNPPPIEENT